MATVTRWSAALLAALPMLVAPEGRAQWVTTTSPLPDATEGIPYSLQLTAAGGVGGYVWGIGGSLPCPNPGCPPTTGLPQWLTLTRTGLLQGTPQTGGDFRFWILVDDSTGAGGGLLAELHVRPSSAWAFSSWVPVATHGSGLNGSAWRTDVAVLNPGASATDVEIDFHGPGGVVSTTASIPAGAQLALADAVGLLGTSGSGAIEVLSDRPVEVNSRTYNRFSVAASCFSGATEGAEYPGLSPEGGLPAIEGFHDVPTAYLPGLVESGRFRTNIGLLNTGLDAATALVELFDGTSNKLADYTVVLERGQWSQSVQPFRSLAGQTALESGYAKVTVESGFGIFAFASVIDNLTNAPTTRQLVPGGVGGAFIPVATHGSGINGSEWRTDVWVLNASADPASVEVDFVKGDGFLTKTASIPAGAQLLLVDVVGQIGGSGSGAVFVSGSDPLVCVASRTYNQFSLDAPCFPGGTEGTDYPGVDALNGLENVWSASFGVNGQTGYLPGLLENASFRTNIGLVNVSPRPATAFVELLNGVGGTLASYTVVLASGEWSQAVQPFRKLAGETTLDNGYARITVRSGFGVFAFASVIDNVTNAPMLVTMQR